MRNWKKVIGVASAAAMTAAMMMPTSVFAADETFKIGVIGPMTCGWLCKGIIRKKACISCTDTAMF